LHKLHVLFVDCDPNACNKIQQALGSEFMVQGASSVAEAREYLAKCVPDILICEVQLGQESGLELCRFIRNKLALRRLPIMILTSLMTLQDKVAGFDAGADDYVVKPFDARHLETRIRLLLRIKRLQQYNEL
jgi:DNA-binding response OmpR family regulator